MSECTLELTGRPTVSVPLPDECLFYIYFFSPVTTYRPSIPTCNHSKRSVLTGSIANQSAVSTRYGTNIVDDTAVIPSGRSTTGADGQIRERGFRGFLTGIKFEKKKKHSVHSAPEHTDFIIIKSNRSCNRSTPLQRNTRKFYFIRGRWNTT